MSRHILTLALLALPGCGNKANPPVPAVAPISVPIPAEAPYKIISDGEDGPARRLVDVRLREKVTPEALREIALEVKSREERRNERTVIFYYLPVIFPELAGEPWASTHFTPELEVKILGLSIEEAAAMRKFPLDHKGKRVGAWLLDNQYKTLDLIYEDGGLIKIAEIQSPTARIDSDMVEISSPIGRRFKKLRGSNIYEVDHEGNLRIANEDGKIFAAARPIR